MFFIIKMEVSGHRAVLKHGKLNEKIRNINLSFLNHFLLLLLVSKAQTVQLNVLYGSQNKQQLVAKPR